MATNRQFGVDEDVFVKSMRLESETRTLAGDLTLYTNSPSMQFVDTDSAARNCTIPLAAVEGKVFVIKNTSSGAGTLTVKDDAGSPNTIGTVAYGATGWFIKVGSAWQQFA